MWHAVGMTGVKSASMLPHWDRIFTSEDALWECGGSTPLWYFSAQPVESKRARVRKPSAKSQSGVEPPHSQS